MATESFELQAPGIAKTVALLDALVQNSKALRQVRSLNAPRVYSTDFQQITSAAAQQMNRVQSQRDKVLSGVYLTFSAISGAGKYRMDGGDATTTFGADIPAGFYELWIEGVDNLRNFSIIATTATDVRMTMQFFD